jgi:tRNA(Arg) A34 adenosine deaminase TadA
LVQPDILMTRAIALAMENVRAGRGGPFGALVVRDGEVIAEGTNLVTSNNDPTAHAEIVAIREACRKLGSFQLTGCELYSSCEPCPMCMGAIYWARLKRLCFGADRQDAAAFGFDDSHIYDELCLPHSARSIVVTRQERDKALEAFREWQRMPQKIPY